MAYLPGAAAASPQNRGRFDPVESCAKRMKICAKRMKILNAAAAVDGDDLTGDVRRIPRQEQGGARNVLRGAVALERGLVDDFALERIVHVTLGPEHRPRCDAVDADFRSELARQCPGQHRESR